MFVGRKICGPARSGGPGAAGARAGTSRVRPNRMPKAGRRRRDGRRGGGRRRLLAGWPWPGVDGDWPGPQADDPDPPSHLPARTDIPGLARITPAASQAGGRAPALPAAQAVIEKDRRPPKSRFGSLARLPPLPPHLLSLHFHQPPASALETGTGTCSTSSPGRARPG